MSTNNEATVSSPTSSIEVNNHSNNSSKGPPYSTSDGDSLYEETRKGARESAIIAEFMKKRVKIEEEYARALLQLCKSFPSGSRYALFKLRTHILYQSKCV
jgi:Fes/CIP4, and EFC/F-BAR homology domain